MQSTDSLLSELTGYMAALSSDSRVYVKAGRYAESAPDIAELVAQIHELLAQVGDDVAWKRYFAPSEPLTPQGIEGSLEPIEIDDAAAFMASVATVDIIWPSHHFMDRDEAVHAATCVVSLLGQGATWWTNHDSYCGATNLVTPVFDSLISGTSGEFFAIVLQVADD